MRKLASRLSGLFLLLGTINCQGPQESLDARRQVGDLLIESTHPPQIARDSLIARVVVTNTADTSVQVLVAGGCTTTVRIYQDRHNRLVWDSERALALGDCAAILSTLHFGPRAARTFQSTIAVSDILGDSLRHGHYFVESALHLDQEVVTLQNGEVILK